MTRPPPLELMTSFRVKLDSFINMVLFNYINTAPPTKPAKLASKLRFVKSIWL
jgi:hypothetical protein